MLSKIMHLTANKYFLKYSFRRSEKRHDSRVSLKLLQGMQSSFGAHKWPKGESDFSASKHLRREELLHATHCVFGRCG